MKKEKINVTLDPDVVAALKKAAKAERMQVSPYLQILLRAHFGMTKMLQNTTNLSTPVNKSKLPSSREVEEQLAADREAHRQAVLADWDSDEGLPPEVIANVRAREAQEAEAKHAHEERQRRLHAQAKEKELGVSQVPKPTTNLFKDWDEA